MSQLKVKGLIVGPIHVSSANQSDDLNLMEVDPSAGNLTDLEALIATAHRKSECLFNSTQIMLNAAIQ